MTLAAQVLPGTSYMLTRRTTRRYFLFRPDQDGTQQNIFLYCLAVAAEKKGVEVHAVTCMSDHPHLVVTDVRGTLPKFLHQDHRLLANATKCHRGWPEEVFNKAGTSKVKLCSVGAWIDEIAYCIANPVACFAVRRARDWPGVTVLPEDIGTKEFEVPRPDVYFDPKNPEWPEVAHLKITMPKVLLDAFGLEGAQHQIAARVAQLEEEAHADARRQGKGFGTPHSAMQCKHTVRASSWEPFGARNPTFAAGGDQEAAQRAREQRRAFLESYQACLSRWQRGERDMLWPAGTWKMRVLHAVRCRPPP